MSNFLHKPVMLTEVLEMLQPRSGGKYADGTLGGGGHACAILEASQPDGWLYGSDRDGAALESARKRLEAFPGRYALHRGNFSEITEWVRESSCAGCLLDLGVSSPQLDNPQRGFSFSADGPLDMRMDDRQALTAARLVNESSAGELADWFFHYGGERHARRLARSIVESRLERPFQTTAQLAALIEREMPRHGQRLHPATRVFQALRMVVNREVESLQAGLEACWRILEPGGRLVVITFHSVEDRVVKQFGNTRARDYEAPGEVDVPELRRSRPPLLRWVSRKAIQPGPVEIRENPRARSAQLRVMEKL